MRLLMMQQATLGRQALSPGVQVDIDDAAAALLLDAGAARTLDKVPAAGTSNPVLDGMLDIPPAPARRRLRTQA
ncbi:hypothetical protein MOJ79_18130 [Calidifontimicrobium sp. SYSU G02091]|uniref:hypothetical protein n=1 Tax=Calidifontimicrobium sp. SYSU G02091 TaxID=2926421 RepID=UPI001F52D458|nr:hypothetical protein [Calidifontimicrobium sp. SYSU G02091]MCI1193754.1 hypothetical protein [Calidifontimicrobium sp. SYSU G02091]